MVADVAAIASCWSRLGEDVGVGRIDFHHDPAAPVANSIVPSVTVAVRDQAGRILLVHKIDNDYWALPGGAVDLGESVADAALREVAEETGVLIELTGLVGIYTDPGHVMAYDDGEVRQQFSICFNARLISGMARQDEIEIKAVQWVDPSNMPSMKIRPSVRRRIDDAIAGRAEPQID